MIHTRRGKFLQSFKDGLFNRMANYSQKETMEENEVILKDSNSLQKGLSCQFLNSTNEKLVQ
jgi:hypothetical protein